MTDVDDPKAEWVPGDPLYDDPNIAHQRFLFNFRDDAAAEREECRCGDAAGWPTPKMDRALPPGDELGQFIAEYHEWRQQLPVEPRKMTRIERGLVHLAQAIGVHL